MFFENKVCISWCSILWRPWKWVLHSATSSWVWKRWYYNVTCLKGLWLKCKENNSINIKKTIFEFGFMWFWNFGRCSLGVTMVCKVWQRWHYTWYIWKGEWGWGWGWLKCRDNLNNIKENILKNKAHLGLGFVWVSFKPIHQNKGMFGHSNKMLCHLEKKLNARVHYDGSLCNMAALI